MSSTVKNPVQKLREWRNYTTPPSEQSPQLVIVLAPKALKSSSLLSGEEYEIREQYTLAFAQVGKITEAKDQYNILELKFGKTSSRVTRLRGAIAEAEGNWDSAILEYSQAIERDETDGISRKRIANALWMSGKRNQALDALSNYLDHFMSDIEGWFTLSNWYMEEYMFQQAAFCLEECLLLRPAHHLYRIRYGEILSTLGDHRNALSAFCGTVEMCADNARGWYGVLNTLRKLKRSSKNISVNEKEKWDILEKIAVERLRTIYSKNGDRGGLVGKVVDIYLKESFN